MVTTVFRTELTLVEPLLRLSFKSFAPKKNYKHSNDIDGVIYANPPTESNDYDDAFHEAQRLFSQVFGTTEEFLIRDEGDDVENNDE